MSQDHKKVVMETGLNTERVRGFDIGGDSRDAEAI